VRRPGVADLTAFVGGDQQSASTLPPSGYWHTAPVFLGQRAFVLNALGDHTAADQAARDCLAEMPPAWTSSEWASRRRELADLT
jgi:hypothetical protein